LEQFIFPPNNLIFSKDMDREKLIITHDPFVLNFLSYQTHLNGVNMELTKKEFSLLALFINNIGKINTSDFIYETVWGKPTKADYPELRKHICYLRKKLDKGNSGYTITAVLGKGYCFQKR